MTRRTYKNVYGDGRIEYVEYEIADPAPEDDTEATAEDYEAALGRFGV